MINFEPYRGISPGKIITRELKKRNISQRDFSVKIDMHFQTLNNVIKGHRKLTLPQAVKIEQALNLDEGLLMVLQLYIDIDKLKKNKAKPHGDTPTLRKILFWDIDLDKIDWTIHRDFIIKRVMERGNDSEKAAISSFYNLPET